MRKLDLEIRRRERLEALEQAAGAWTDADHPELANGADAWVREMRDASVKRLQELEGDGDAESVDPSRRVV
jgi:hypothetical protein